MEEYLQALQKKLRGFPPEEQAALMEEIRSHVESGAADPRMGQDPQQRTKKLMNELCSAKDMGSGFKALYRPNRFVDYLLVVIPYLLYPLLNMLYLRLRPQYAWMDVRIDVLLHLPLVAIGLWRRSAAVTLFWVTLIAGQLLYVVTQGFWQSYWYFGVQTILWAILLAGLLALFGFVVWKNRHDLLVVAYGLLPLSVIVLGVTLWIIHPMSYSSYGPVDRSLLAIFLELEGRSIGFYGISILMASFFLPTNRSLRWMALAAWAAMMGLGRQYL